MLLKFSRMILILSRKEWAMGVCMESAYCLKIPRVGPGVFERSPTRRMWTLRPRVCRPTVHKALSCESGWETQHLCALPHVYYKGFSVRQSLMFLIILVSGSRTNYFQLLQKIYVKKSCVFLFFFFQCQVTLVLRQVRMCLIASALGSYTTYTSY